MLLLSLKGCYKEKKLEAMTVAGEDIGLIELYLFYIPNRFIRPSIELLNQPGFTGSLLYARTYNGWDRHRNLIPLHPYRVAKEQTWILDSLEQHSHTWPTQGPQCSGGPEIILHTRGCPVSCGSPGGVGLWQTVLIALKFWLSPDWGTVKSSPVVTLLAWPSRDNT